MGMKTIAELDSKTPDIYESLSSKYTEHIHKIKNAKQKVINANFDISQLSNRRKGIRHRTRSENMNILMNTVENDESFENDFNKLMEQSVSPLSSLFLEQEKMQIWNDFANRSEEIQMLMLKKGIWDLDCSFSEDDDDNFDILAMDENSLKLSADVRFKKLDAGLRKFLRKQSYPTEILMNLEKEIIPFFEEDPNSIYVSNLENCKHRLLLHGLCQYLNLISESFDTAEGNRQTQVENLHQYFSAPDKTLSQYILKAES